MAELFTATDEVTYADGDMLAGRRAGALNTGLRKFTLSNLALYISGKLFGSLAGAAGKQITVNATNDGFILASANPSYRLGFSIETTTPAASEVLLRHVFTSAVTFADDFAGSKARLRPTGSNPATSQVFNISLDGTTIGTLTISTGGVSTFLTTGGALACAIGDELRMDAPTAPDANIVGVSVTLLATE